MLATTLVRREHVRSFHVHLAPSNGWETSERLDQVVKRQRHTDWQRVEQTLARFAREISHLREEGWREARTDTSPPTA